MKEAFYFPHDTNAINDPKLMNLFMSCGLSWIGIYWILIEILHTQSDWYISQEQFENFVKWYSMREKWWEDFVQHLLNTLSTSWLFCFTDDHKVYSKRVLENKNFREEIKEKRSFAWRESARKRALQKENSTSVEQNSTNDEQGKERKGKEKKEKEIKHIYWEYKNVRLTEKQKEKLIQDYWENIYEKFLKVLDEWIQMKWYKYQDHNLAMRNWIRREEEKKVPAAKINKSDPKDFLEWL